MRADEKFVHDAMVSCFGNAGTVRTWEPVQDPPDFFLELDGIASAVEVTGLSPSVGLTNGLQMNRTSMDRFGLNLCSLLNSSVGSNIPEGYSLHLYFHLPFMDGVNSQSERAVCLKAPKAVLNDSVLPAGPSSEWISFRIFDSALKVRWIAQRPSGLKIVGSVNSSGQNLCLQDDAALMLAKSLESKEKKCANLRRAGHSCWLALHKGNWPLSDSAILREAYSNLDVKHSFKRVLYVSELGEVTDLA